jgi:peptide/nickel transport system substrate-binding protein
MAARCGDHVQSDLDKDADLRTIQNKNFRALLAIDRKQIQESAFLGLGEIRQPVAPPWMPHYPGDAVAKKYTEFNAAEANKLLDGIGMDKKDSEGFRYYPGTTKRAVIELSWVNAFGPWGDVGQIVSRNWEKVGVKTSLVERQRALHFQMRDANELQSEMWQEDSGAFPFSVTTKYDRGHWQRGWFTLPACGQVGSTSGKEGVAPSADRKRSSICLTKPKYPVKPIATIAGAPTAGGQHAGDRNCWSTPMVQGVAVVNNTLNAPWLAMIPLSPG